VHLFGVTYACWCRVTQQIIKNIRIILMESNHSNFFYFSILSNAGWVLINTYSVDISNIYTTWEETMLFLHNIKHLFINIILSILIFIYNTVLCLSHAYNTMSHQWHYTFINMYNTMSHLYVLCRLIRHYIFVLIYVLCHLIRYSILNYIRVGSRYTNYALRKDALKGATKVTF